MPDKFVVPQFIENEDKILGPITVRQFLILLVAAFVVVIEYSIFQFWYGLIAELLSAGIAIVFAFVKINGQPFHLFFVNFMQTEMRPQLRIWDKTFTTEELKLFVASKPPPPPPMKEMKEYPTSTRLRDLSLTVNTGGVYNPEED